MKPFNIETYLHSKADLLQNPINNIKTNLFLKRNYKDNATHNSTPSFIGQYHKSITNHFPLGILRIDETNDTNIFLTIIIINTND